MTIIEEKEALEIEKLKLEVKKFLKEDPLRLKIDFYKVILLTIAVTAAVVTTAFKIFGA